MRLFTLTSPETNPYRNLARERLLFERLEEDAVVLYLWQNAHTVVCGRNQNVWKECHVSRLLAEGGHLARRLSGGGAVFHDLGNLNFTFLAHTPHYDVEKQLRVIAAACASLGIDVRFSGRNDLLADGRKFSGSAFFQRETRHCHHGTLMVDVDGARMSRYLNVDREKLAAKGVASVRARVVNLVELCPGLTTTALAAALLSSFASVYGGQPRALPEPEEPALQAGAAFFASEDWIYGASSRFDYALHRRFPWGDITLELRVENRTIADARLYSDALDECFIRTLAAALPGLPGTGEALASAARQTAQSPAQRAMAEDLAAFFLETL